MDKFDAKLAVIQRCQDEHLVRVATRLGQCKATALETARRHHDGLLDPLVRALLDALHDQGQADSYSSQLLSTMLDATCLTLRTNVDEIRHAVECAWKLVIAIDDVDYIREFTQAGEDDGRLRLVAHALETIKAWILVTERALDRVQPRLDPRRASRYLRHYMRHSSAETVRRRYMGPGPITGPHGPTDPE